MSFFCVPFLIYRLNPIYECIIHFSIINIMFVRIHCALMGYLYIQKADTHLYRYVLVAAPTRDHITKALNPLRCCSSVNIARTKHIASRPSAQQQQLQQQWGTSAGPAAAANATAVKQPPYSQQVDEKPTTTTTTPKTTSRRCYRTSLSRFSVTHTANMCFT